MEKRSKTLKQISLLFGCLKAHNTVFQKAESSEYKNTEDNADESV